MGSATLAITAFLLTASTFTHPPPALFFVFVQAIAIVSSAAGSYYQTAIVAVGGAALSPLGRAGV